MLTRILHYPSSPLETQASYFLHRTKSALIQQIILAVICYGATEAVLGLVSKSLSANKDVIVSAARDIVVDVQEKQLAELSRRQQKKNGASEKITSIEDIGSVDGDHYLPLAKMILAFQDEPTAFFGPAVVKEFLGYVGLKNKSDTTTSVKGVAKPLIKEFIFKRLFITRLIGFSVIAVADVLTRPLIELHTSINTARAIAHFSSARADGTSGVYSMSTTLSLNNVIEFQSQVLNFWLGRFYSSVCTIVDPFLAPSRTVAPLRNDAESQQIMQDTLFGTMNLTDICIYTAGLELVMQLRMLPLISSFGSAKAVATKRIVKREIPRMIGRWAIFLGTTVGLTKVTKFSTYTCSIIGFVAGLAIFPWSANQ
jgi:hypothetical protein